MAYTRMGSRAIVRAKMERVPSDFFGAPGPTGSDGEPHGDRGMGLRKAFFERMNFG